MFYIYGSTLYDIYKYCQYGIYMELSTFESIIRREGISLIKNKQWRFDDQNQWDKTGI